MSINSTYCSELTLAMAMRRLQAAGYRRQLSPEAGGGVRVGSTDLVLPSGDLRVDRIVRFEGASDPDDQACLLAVRWSAADEEARGLLVLAYGPSASPEEGELLRELVAEGAA